MSGSAELRAAGSAALGGAGHPRLEIDLSAVSFIDSTGLGALIHLRNLTNEQTGTLLLVEPSEAVLRLLALTRLDDVFTISAKPSPHADPH